LTKIDVLNKGYVRLVDHMGNDVSVVNAARCSFDRETQFDADGNLKEKDRKLIDFLYRNREMSVFRHATLQFEMYMPLMVARQYWKYIVGASHIDDGTCMNESSRRYITDDPVFYVPAFNEWRGAPADKKQGSGAALDERLGSAATEELLDYIDKGLEKYNKWLLIGAAPEQARLFLPAYGMFIRIRTTMSLAALLHFLQERLRHRAQQEIFVYAQTMHDLVRPLFPATFDAVFGEASEVEIDAPVQG
jgi:thymidylate synthase (FAD)